MTDTDNTIILGGRIVGFTPPTQGQLEIMVRIGRTIRASTDDDVSEFWQIQINRIGILLESLIAEADRDIVDTLYLTGKIDHNVLLGAILAKVKENAEESEDRAIEKAKGKASPVRVQRK
jgi:hypothetical protein